MNTMELTQTTFAIAGIAMIVMGQRRLKQYLRSILCKR